MIQTKQALGSRTRMERLRRFMAHNWQLYILLLPAFVWLIVFCYAPMYGVTIAFKDYKVKLGITGSPWAGFKYFEQFFSTSVAVKSIRNTLLLSLYSLLFGFPIPILFALMLNMLRSARYKKFIQTLSFAPHFISVVVVVSMMNIMFAPSNGWVNKLITSTGAKEVLFMTRSEYFRTMYVASGIWQDMGFNAIVYIAALAGVSPELHEAAIVDGASKVRRLIHIDIPCILPTVTIMFILSVGNLFSVGYEKAYLMQGGLNTEVSEIISTYVYKVGLQSAQYSFSAAVGLFNSVVNLVLLLAVNTFARKMSDVSLF
ncbi:ABC transporter permease [Beduinella massiliensis]|uniref:ABC transporter permease n=1 Tax=Beduinella massiliensis TaxID=1852363 RepID=UPI0031F9C374